MKTIVFVAYYQPANEVMRYDVFATAAAAERWRQQIARERWLERKKAKILPFEATFSFKTGKSLVNRLRNCDRDANATKLLLDALRKANDEWQANVTIEKLLIRPNDDEAEQWEHVIGRNKKAGWYPYYHDDRSEAGRPSDDPRADADAWFDGNHGDGRFWTDKFFVNETEVIGDDDLYALGTGGEGKGAGARIIPWRR
jgi:hypothetical protein